MEFLKGEEDISSASWKFFVVSAEGVEQVGTRTGVRGYYVYAFVVAVAHSMAFSNVPLATGVSLPFHVAETGSQDGLRGNRRGAHIVGSIRAVVLGRI